MKNILVLGGSYFAGRVLVEELHKRGGVHLHVFNRGRYPLHLDGVSELVGNREEPEHLRQVIPQKHWDAVIDFCAYVPQHVEGAVRYIPGEIGHYVFISTTTVYAQTWQLPITENAAKLSCAQTGLGAHDDYGYNKLLTERALEAVCEQRAIPHTALRPAIIYGPYNYAPREIFYFNLLFDKQPLPLPHNRLALFNFVWVVDMAHLIELCLNDERVYGQAFNLASDELISYESFIDVLEQIAGKSLARTELSIETISEQQIALPFPLDEHLVYSGEKIRRLFDFEYTPFASGMRETLKYFLMVRKMGRGEPAR